MTGSHRSRARFARPATKDWAMVPARVLGMALLFGAFGIPEDAVAQVLRLPGRLKEGAPFRILGLQPKLYFPFEAPPGIARQPIPAAVEVLASALYKVEGGCTATHVGGGYLVTAGHCVINAKGITTTNRAAQSLWVYGYDIQEQRPTEVGVRAQVITHEYRAGFDSAVLYAESLAGQPALPVDYESWSVGGPLRLSGTTQVQIIGLSSSRLGYSSRCNAEASSSVPNGPPTMFLHDCDTEAGDSGAPLLRNGRVVGIHAGSFREVTDRGPRNYAFPTQQIPWVERVCTSAFLTHAPLTHANPILFRIRQHPGLGHALIGFSATHSAPQEVSVELLAPNGVRPIPWDGKLWTLEEYLEVADGSSLGLRIFDQVQEPPGSLPQGEVTRATIAFCP